MEVEVLDLLDLDAAEVLVLLNVHLGRVQRRRGLQHGYLDGGHVHTWKCSRMHSRGDHLARRLLYHLFGSSAM